MNKEYNSNDNTEQTNQYKDQLMKYKSELADLERQKIIAEEQLKKYNDQIQELFGTTDQTKLAEIKNHLIEQLKSFED